MPRALAFLIVATLSSLPLTAAGLTDAGVDAPPVRVERPPAGSLRRGVLPVPDWVVYTAGGLIVCAAGGALLWRSSRR